MPNIKIIKDGVSNIIVASMSFAQKAYPTSAGYSHENLTLEPTEEELLNVRKIHAREWRDNELLKTDSLSLLTDHPKKTEIAAYRVKLRDWPSTSDFPNTRPVME